MIIIQPNCFKYDAESVERIQNRGYLLHVEVYVQCTHTCSSLIILITYMQWSSNGQYSLNVMFELVVVVF